MVVVESSGKLSEPKIPATPELMHGLGNLLQNARQHAREKVSIRTFWDDQEMHVTIADDGAGFNPEILTQVGEPFVPRAEQKNGLGLGIFIAKTLLEQTGARLNFTNHPNGGAIANIHWKRKSLENFLKQRNADILPMQEAA
jgi:two-component system sensor histidine kinase RegB